MSLTTVSFRLLDVYGFFLEWCPAIHDGDTDDDEKYDEDLIDSMDSDYSVITMPKDEDEVWCLEINLRSTWSFGLVVATRFPSFSSSELPCYFLSLLV